MKGCGRITKKAKERNIHIHTYPITYKWDTKEVFFKKFQLTMTTTTTRDVTFPFIDLFIE